MNNNVQTMQSLYAAFGRGDIDAIVDSVTGDVSWGVDSVIANEIPWYRVRSGPDGVRDFFATLARDVEFPQFTPRLFVASDEDDVIVLVDFTYRMKKNGRTASLTSVHCFKIRGGKVSRFRAFEDTAAVREAWNG
jgi:ketosteroid isomerase-like protein